MPRRRDVEEVEGLMIVGRLEHDARAVDQVDHRHQKAVDEDRRGGGEDEVVRRRIGTQRPAPDPHLSRRPAGKWLPQSGFL